MFVLQNKPSKKQFVGDLLAFGSLGLRLASPSAHFAFGLFGLRLVQPTVHSAFGSFGLRRRLKLAPELEAQAR